MVPITITGFYIKNYAKRQDIGQTSGKMHLILKIKICVIRYSKRSNYLESEASCMSVKCSALGDLHIYTKHILANDQNYYITEMLEKISDGLHIRDGVYIT